MPKLPSYLVKPQLLKSLGSCKIYSVTDFLQAEFEKLVTATFGEEELIEVTRQLIRNYSTQPKDALTLYRYLLRKTSIIQTFIKGLDDLLNGGLLTGTLLEICGLSGTGKTQICLTITVNIVLKMKSNVTYIDTKRDFCSSRVLQILQTWNYKEETDTVLERINVIPADDIYKLITLLQSIKNVLPSSEKFGKLIVIDSLAVLFFPFIGAPNNQVLKEESYSVGRSPSCDISLTSEEIKSTLLTRISKVHFKLTRDTVEGGKQIIYLEDLSSNGTYINGIKVGHNNKVILTSSDEISLASPSYKVFIYLDTKRSAEQWLTQDLCTNFLVLKHLGTGGFGDVKLVINKKTFHKYAMKKVENASEREGVIFNEVNILKRLKHPCIIHFESIYETGAAVYIALEYMSGGNLMQRINSKTRLPENECKMIFYQLTLGVKYLHEEGIVHRDLKPENVLLEVRGKRNDTVVKITDFGLSKILHSMTNLRTACGTLKYTAPEVIKVCAEKYIYTHKVDIWSLGVILFLCQIFLLNNKTKYVGYTDINCVQPIQIKTMKGLMKEDYVFICFCWLLLLHEK
ncbi:ovarian-specific serine/threonine-protein kinase loki isoform X2 [Rhodnius prolixus]|uniref:ovarian-specific serine/threonine-protein kinase loki isoform X2 n=1 Tax=Rhodnius prolixus TaxID=13249 RepID=UPI003D18DF52